MNQSNPDRIKTEEEISLKDISNKIKSGARYIKSKRIIVLIVSIAGMLLGLAYSILKKPTYTAVCTFVLEEGDKGGLGQYSSLASLAGINLGGGGNGGGIFQGDNILDLYKSRTMIEKGLLSTCTIDGKKQLLIDRFIDYYKMRSKQKGDGKIGAVNFNGDPESFSRIQDSIITIFVEMFNKRILTVTKPDKKNIIKVEVVSKDEQFSKCFADKMVENVNSFYIETKTKKEALNVRVLQHQADSVRTILDSSLHGVASAIEADPNANPLMATLRVTSQKKEIDVQANTAIYSEIVKNLEVEKISLRQETPLIQVIDKPVYPLTKYQMGKLFGAILGMIAGLFFISGILIVKRVIEKS